MNTLKTSISKINVLDVPLYAGDIEKAVKLVLEDCEGGHGQNHCISATGAHGLVYSQRNSKFKETLNSFYLNLPDGMPGVWIGRLKGAKKIRRCYGPDFFKALLTESATLQVTHYFCGGNPGIAEELKAQVLIKFHNEKIVGTYCPEYLDVEQYNYSEIAGKIDLCKPDVVWVGLSTPKQEIFIKKLSEHTKVKFLISVGAAFDFHTDRIAQASPWIQKIGMEWFFRLVMEPTRLYKRYLEIVPLFFYYNFMELIRFTFEKTGLR